MVESKMAAEPPRRILESCEMMVHCPTTYEGTLFYFCLKICAVLTSVIEHTSFRSGKDSGENHGPWQREELVCDTTQPPPPPLTNPTPLKKQEGSVLRAENAGCETPQMSPTDACKERAAERPNKLPRYLTPPFPVARGRGGGDWIIQTRASRLQTSSYSQNVPFFFITPEWIEDYVDVRPRSRSEGAIRATLTRTPSASLLLSARRAVFPPRRCTVQIRSVTQGLKTTERSDIVVGADKRNSSACLHAPAMQRSDAVIKASGHRLRDILETRKRLQICGEYLAPAEARSAWSRQARATHTRATVGDREAWQHCCNKLNWIKGKCSHTAKMNCEYEGLPLTSTIMETRPASSLIVVTSADSAIVLKISHKLNPLKVRNARIPTGLSGTRGRRLTFVNRRALPTLPQCPWHTVSLASAGRGQGTCLRACVRARKIIPGRIGSSRPPFITSGCGSRENAAGFPDQHRSYTSRNVVFIPETLLFHSEEIRLEWTPAYVGRVRERARESERERARARESERERQLGVVYRQERQQRAKSNLHTDELTPWIQRLTFSFIASIPLLRSHLRSKIRKYTPKFSVEEIETEFQSRIKTYAVKNVNAYKEPNNFLNDVKETVTGLINKHLKSLKVNMKLFTEYKRGIGVNIEYVESSFKTKNKIILKSTNLEEYYTNSISKIIAEMGAFEAKRSQWVLNRIFKLEVRINKYVPFKDSSYVDLPEKIKTKQAVINVKNNDQKCYLWSVLSALHQIQKYPQRVNKYIAYEHEFDDALKGLEFPMKLDSIPTFEKRSGISINVYAYEEEDGGKEYIICPLKTTKK
ncbi:hypothetical protein PR048_030256 [Dryococelus australis]|uniref:Uncharacterized protein n=1 Tax=Dryococelus australis TaxID=614101 RepID=A0ABQ9G8I5_9NEOP|nr:hypothetical protein PR048_030256 [Dryococelus australis]